MNFPQNLKYTKDHEWAAIASDGTATIGITDHAQNSLGEVVFVDLPKVGRELKEHETFGVVESIKAVSDLYSPLAGSVVETNSAVSSDPGLINREPHETGWLIKVKLTDPSSASKLMSASEYTSFVQSQT